MKVIFKIGEDDPRNPGVIADCTGDNAGDSVGPTADGFETYGVTGVALISFIILALANTPELQALLIVWIFAMRILMVFTSIFSYGINHWFSSSKYKNASNFNFETPLTTLVWITSIVSIIVTFAISYLLLNNNSLMCSESIIGELKPDPSMWWRLASIISLGQTDVLTGKQILDVGDHFQWPDFADGDKVELPVVRVGHRHLPHPVTIVLRIAASDGEHLIAVFSLLRDDVNLCGLVSEQHLHQFRQVNCIREQLRLAFRGLVDDRCIECETGNEVAQVVELIGELQILHLLQRLAKVFKIKRIVVVLAELFRHHEAGQGGGVLQ